MRELLEMEDSADFDEEHFNKAGVMLIETMRDMSGYCTRLYNDSSLTYGTFEHFLTDCTGCHEPHGHAISESAESKREKYIQGLAEMEEVMAQEEHGHAHDFDWNALDQYSHVVNHTYVPENNDCPTVRYYLKNSYG